MDTVGTARTADVGGLRMGIAHHFGWAVAVAASSDHRVVDRRRIELIEPGIPSAPVHNLGGAHQLHRCQETLSDEALAAVVQAVRESVTRMASKAFESIASSLPEPVASLSVRAWPVDFPEAVAAQRRVPYESRADSIMYRRLLADTAHALGWPVHLYGGNVEEEAIRILGDRADDVLRGPRKVLGPPWSKDHRTALAATVVAGGGRPVA